ncbi:MAG: hypothetical protein ACLR17_00405 [Enterobacteriaceae bacterium]
MSDRMFSEPDQVFQDILDGVSLAGAPYRAQNWPDSAPQPAGV